MVAVLAVASQVAAALFARRYRRFAISGQSMTPTLSPGDWVLVDEHAYRTKLPERGDVVVLADPREPQRHLVKRITSVDLHGEVRVEGDNAAESTDSRHFGPVPAKMLIGRVRWRYWPSSKVGSVL